MTTKKEGPLTRLARRLGLGKTSGGGGVYESCWACSLGKCGACSLGKCGAGFERTCACCRAGHSGIR
jgi:hypothetical protein